MFEFVKAHPRQSLASRVSPTVVTLLGLVVFWVLLRLAALQQPDYELARDTISSLASHGAEHAWIAMLALATGGVGTIGVSLLVRRVSQPAALALGLAGVSLFIVAITRIDCQGGAAGCLMRDATDVLIARMHRAGTVLYEIGFLGAVATTALCIWRAGSRAAPVVAVIGLVLSILSFAVPVIGVGLGQRVWLLVHSAMIVALLSWPPIATRSSSRR